MFKFCLPLLWRYSDFSQFLRGALCSFRKKIKICEEENIKLKFQKCVSAQDKINFLDYEIKGGCIYITPDNHNIESIKKLQPLQNVKKLQSFLGSVNVYNKFIDSYAKIREPFNELLQKNKPCHWSTKCQEAFELLKNKLITKPIFIWSQITPICVLWCFPSYNWSGFKTAR